MPKTDSIEGTYILNEVYPMIESKMDSSTISSYKRLIGQFIQSRSESLYDTAPCDRIPFTKTDEDNVFNLFKINPKDITDSVSNTFYGKIQAFNKLALPAKDECTLTLLCIVRYFLLNKKKYEKELEMSLIHLCFSGKYYPIIHWESYKTFTPAKYRHIMDYAVSQLSQKFNLVKYGSVLKAVLSTAYTWLETYEDDRFKTFDDEDVVYLVQQLNSRLRSFMQEIAEVYYKAYDNKDYISYDSDDMSEDGYRLADNDSFKAERAVEKAIDKIVSSGVDMEAATKASRGRIKVNELRSIIDTLTSDKKYLVEIKELIRLLVVEYMHNSTDKDIGTINFVTTSTSSKPNTKNPNIIRIKELLESWLDDSSPNYRKRKSRTATKLAYNKSVLIYFTLVTYKANR